MTDGVHASVVAVQNTESACTRFASVVCDRLPSVERELRRVSEALDERCDELRREISDLHCDISSAAEDEDTSWAASRIEEARQELSSVQRHIRRVSEAGDAYDSHARQVQHLATDHAILTREFLRGTADDLRAYFSKTLDISSTSKSAKATVPAHQPTQASGPDAHELLAAPVSAAVDIEGSDSVNGISIRNALASIDEVHKDGALPRVRVRNTEAELNGYFMPASGPQGLTVDHLGIRSTGPWPELTMLHETAHLLDLEGFGRKGAFATSSSDSIVQGVMDAANASKAILFLKQKRSSTNSPRLCEYYNYLLKDQEVWARAYAQFVAQRCSNPTLKTQLNSALSTEEGRQWAEDDFVQIDGEIEKMFNTLGWLC